jgi:phage terminase small subunit
MSRGGYRPGAGRKKGSKDVKIAKPENIIFLAKAEEFAQFYKGVLDRTAAGKKPSADERQKMAQLAAELSKTYTSGGEDKKLDDYMPLDFMLRVMNDPALDMEMRVRAASLVAPYIHAKVGEGKGGKKEEKSEKAKQAGAGRFAPGRPPLALVK